MVVLSGTTLPTSEEPEEPAEPAELVVACWPLVVFWSSGVEASESVEEVELGVCAEVVEGAKGVVLGREVELEVVVVVMSVAIGGVV